MRTITTTLAALLLTLPSLAGPPASVDGRWKVIVDVDGERRESYIDFSQDGTKVTAVYQSPEIERLVIKEGSYRHGALQFAFKRDFDGNEVRMEFRGKATGQKRIEGTVKAGDREIARATMERLPSPLGKWKVQAVAPAGDQTFDSILDVTRVDGVYGGTMTSERGVIKLGKLRWKDAGLVVNFTLPIQDQQIPIVLDLKFTADDRLAGRWSAQGVGYEGKWSATRIAAPPAVAAGGTGFLLPGRWNVTAETEDAFYLSVLEIAAAGDGFSGVYSGELGKVDYRNVSRHDGQVFLELAVEIDGNPITFQIKASPKGDNTLEGRWHVKDAADFGGRWSATRETVPGEGAEFAGTWRVSTLIDGDRELPFSVELKETDGELTGVIIMRNGKFALRDVKTDGKTISFAFLFGNDSKRIDVKGEVTGNSISGAWEAADGGSGDWSGTRVIIADL